jgi:hypothetical protein
MGRIAGWTERGCGVKDGACAADGRRREEEEVVMDEERADAGQRWAKRHERAARPMANRLRGEEG